MSTIILKDGRREWTDKDSHFRDLVREYMGDQAAEWYERRIESFDQIHQQVDELFPDTSSETAIIRSLDRMSIAQFQALLYTLDELRGWDE